MTTFFIGPRPPILPRNRINPDGYLNKFDRSAAISSLKNPRRLAEAFEFPKTAEGSEYWRSVMRSEPGSPLHLEASDKVRGMLTRHAAWARARSRL